MAKKTDTLPDFGAAIEQLRRLVSYSGDRLLLGDGAPSPDLQLLEICAEIAEARKQYEVSNRAFMDGIRPPCLLSQTEKAEQDARREESKTLGRAFSHKLRAAAKIRATTAAGIYAKAVAVRSSHTGAAKLAMSLAEDLVNNPVLRAALWETDAPAGGADNAAA